MAPPTTPKTPRIFSPTNGTVFRTGGVTIKWTHTLSAHTRSSFYTIYIDDNPEFTSPSAYSTDNSSNVPNNFGYTYGAGTYYVKVRACSVVHVGYDEYTSTYSEWSDTLDFSVDFEAPIGDPEDFLEATRNKRIPAVWGVFQRDDANPDISDGLAIGYLGKFNPDPEYFVAYHPLCTAVQQGSNFQYQLFIPAPGANNVPLEVVLDQDATLGRNTTYASIGWHPQNGVYVGKKDYKLSDADLAPPFGSYTIPDPESRGITGTMNWNAGNKAAVSNNDISDKATIKKHAHWRFLQGSNNMHAQEGGAAWEINDPDGNISSLFESATYPRIWVHYLNFDPVYSINSGNGETDHIKFEICRYVNTADIHDVNAVAIPGTVHKESTVERMVGPLRKDQLSEHSANRNYALMLTLGANTVNEIGGTYVAEISTIGMEVRQVFAGDEKKEAQTAYVGCQGRMYDTWITSFTGSLATILNSLYSLAGNCLAIEDASMITASLCIDVCGMSVSDLDTDSFAAALGIPGRHSMRVNVTEEGATAADVIKEITQQSTFKFTMTPSGKATLISLRPVWHSFSTDATIEYSDVDIDKMKVDKTPLDKVVNVIPVKSRYHAETDRWVDLDEFKNTTSIAKYGEKKPKSPLEFKYVNSGPYERDNSGNSTSLLLYNNVKWQIVHLIEPDEQNGETDTNHYYDDGWWANQHTEVSVHLPGYKFMELEQGSRVVFDNISFENHRVLCFGETWTGKTFIVQTVEKDQDGVTLSVVQAPTYGNFYALRGMNAFIGT